MPGMLENTYDGKPVKVHHTVEDVREALMGEYGDIRHLAREQNALWKQSELHKDREALFKKGPTRNARKNLQWKQRATGTELNY
jgi:hypothetical protein